MLTVQCVDLIAIVLVQHHIVSVLNVMNAEQMTTAMVQRHTVYKIRTTMNVDVRNVMRIVTVPELSLTVEILMVELSVPRSHSNTDYCITNKKRPTFVGRFVRLVFSTFYSTTSPPTANDLAHSLR